MRRVVAFAACAVACGTPAPTVVPLPATASAASSAAPEGVLPQVSANACGVWSSCRRVGEVVRVSESRMGQSPNVAWDGNEALVTYETIGEGTHLAAVATNGRILWTELVPGLYAEIAWNPRSRSGLVVTSETITWLGRDGKPVHRASVPRATNVAFHGGVSAFGEGFLVATGTASHASNSQPVAFSVATIRAPADSIEWKRVDDDGLRGVPVLGPREGVAWIASQPWKAAPQLFSVSNAGAIGAPLALPGAPTGRVAAIGEEHKEPFVVLVGDAHMLSVTTVHDGTATPPIDLGVRSTRSGSAVVFRAFGKLLLGADKIGDSPGVALAPLELGSTPRVGAPLAIGPENSQQLRAVATEDGFLAAWNIADDAAPLQTFANHAPMHALATMLAVYTCCPATRE